MNFFPNGIARARGSFQASKQQQGFTLTELIIVIVVLGILSVFAAPRFFGTSGVDEAALESRVISMLRLQQQRAMQDSASPCFGAVFTAATGRVEPYDCGATVDPVRIIELPSALTLATISVPAGLESAIRFNSLGCPVSVVHETTEQACGSARIQLTITGATTRQICIQSQGYIRPGAC
ncbi:pilus assembly FimT family protein [Aliidiomarina haloalkalitolerans]|uniref:pilus assembly FimT family protein n=1 Tax=Aliidiomarina haloalkalitolerans TaxID=859059 RepID=UPI0013008153|nr:type II secretion system protein [Aliidiomarina haloalkalitolerans]